MERGNSTVSGRATTVGIELAADIAAWLAGVAGMLVSDPCDPCCGGEGEAESTTGLAGWSNVAGPTAGPV